MAEVLLGGKKLGDLKVSELKAELEKRELQRKGIKSVLLTRLKNAILREALTQGDGDDDDDNLMDLDSSQADGSFSEEEDSQQHRSSSEDHEPLANTPTHELDPGHMSGAEEAPPTVNPAPAVVPSPDESAKEGNEESPQEEEEEEEAKEEESDEVLVGVSEKRGAALTERMDSVTIDPSFNPSGEELLYEGDMDAETAPLKLTAEKDNSSQDEGFIVNVHETSMELDMTESLMSHSKAATTIKTTNGSSVGGSGGSNSESKSSGHSSKHSADKGGTNSKGTPSSGKSASSSSERKKQESSSTSGKTLDRCSLWVSGLMPSVRALDLQTLFSPYAQVVSAKVVAKSRTKQLRFGFITVATPEEAQRCIKELNGTELKGKKISVELSKSQPPLHKIAASGTKSSPGMSTSSNSRERSGSSDKKQASSSSKTIIKRSEGSKTSTSSSGKSLADRIVERSRRSVEMRKVTTLSHNKERDNRRKSAPMVHRSRSNSRERISRLSGSRRQVARPFSRSPPHPSQGPGHVSVHSRLGAMPRNADVMQREMAERDMFMRDRERQVEMQRIERNHEIQRQLEVERRREQDMAHHMQELRDRELREREIRERQLIEQERMFKEKERELREREYRERQRREALERELREREVREHHMREREKRLKEIHDKEIRDREIRAIKEREMRDRDARMQIERERELRERERRIKEEQERIDRDRRVRDEQQRWMREEAARLQKERDDSERRERERRQREEKEKRQQEELRLKRERERDQKRERDEMEKRMQGDNGGGRLGKRPYQDNGAYDAKRQAFSSDSYGGPNSSSIFNRLDHKSGRSGPSHQMGGAGMGLPSSGIQPSDLPHVNPEIISAATQALENIRKSVPSVSGNLPSVRGSASLQAQIQQLAAATALASSVGGRGMGVDYHGGGGGMATQSQQYPPNLMRQSMNMRPQGGGGSGAGGMAMLNKSSHIGGGMGGGGMGKLPPEDQRYNRRLGGSRSGGGGGGYRGHPGRQGGPPGRQGGGY